MIDKVLPKNAKKKSKDNNISDTLYIMLVYLAHLKCQKYKKLTRLKFQWEILTPVNFDTLDQKHKQNKIKRPYYISIENMEYVFLNYP